MATYSVVLHRDAHKGFNRLEAKDQKRVRASLQSLEENPLAGKPLKGELSGAYSLRVWPYRIVYTIEKKILVVLVLDIGHRKDIYA